MKQPSQNGFTLLELLVTASVAIAFTAAGWAFQRNQALELGNQSATIDATDTIRAAIGFMTREIRQAGYDPAMTALLIPGAKGISEATSERLWIQFDANGDGLIDVNAADPNAESILYSYHSASREIRRTVAGVTQTLVGNIPAGGLAFEYFGVLGAQIFPTGSPPLLDAIKRDLVALVRVRLQVDAVGTTLPTSLQLASRVTVRSRVLDKL